MDPGTNGKMVFDEPCRPGNPLKYTTVGIGRYFRRLPTEITAKIHLEIDQISSVIIRTIRFYPATLSLFLKTFHFNP